MVLGLCRALLRDPVEAEDAAQQAFLSAHRSLLNGATPREPAAWLATIARNECWSRTRARMRTPLPTDAADAVAGGEDPVAEAIRHADLAALWQAIRALPRTQRDALLLREFGGLRYDELAVALSVTEPAVESLLVRARARLRTQLETAYASIAPALRFLVGSGTPAVAAKVAALGVGAAAVTGGAVVTPDVFEHHHLQPPAPASHVRRAPRRPPPAARIVHSIAAVPPPAPRRPVVQSERREHEQHDGRPVPATTTTTTIASSSDDGGSRGGPGPDGGGGGGGDGGSDGSDGSSGSGDGG